MCEYCDGCSKAFVGNNNKLEVYIDIFRDHAQLHASEIEECEEYRAEINYCPMCGRKLAARD